jgi:hypothetical protein
MRFKTITLLLVILCTVIIGIVTVSSRSQREEIMRLQDAPDKGTIAWQARLARVEGKRRVILPGPLVDYGTAVNSIDEAINNLGLIVAQPIDKKTLISSTNELYRDNKIITWYKFKILQTYSQKSLPTCNHCGNYESTRIPQDMLPLNSDEILIETYGGSVEIDGVEISMVDNEIPAFSESQQYLLFLQTDESGKVGMLRMGAVGIYKVDPSGTLESVAKGKDFHPITQEIQSVHGKSLESIKNHVQLRSNKR